MDNPVPHLEGGPNCWELKVRMSPELLVQIATDQNAIVEIGEPDADGFVQPVLTSVHMTQERLRAVLAATAPIEPPSPERLARYVG